MTEPNSTWRLDVFVLAEDIRDDLAELHAHRPAGEKAGTLDVFIQGLVRTWKDLGFSQQEIAHALAHGAEQEFEKDPELRAYEDRKLTNAAFSKTRVGKLVNGTFVAGAITGLIGLLGLLMTAVFLLAGGPARSVAWISIALAIGGMAVVWAAGAAAPSRQSRYLKLKGGA